jgi:hypothetical protein
MQIGSAQQISLVSAVVDRLRDYIETQRMGAGDRLVGTAMDQVTS